MASSSIDDTTRSPRSTVMRSLSLPYSIEEYAKEIRSLEDRILSENDRNLIRGSGSTMRRSRSTNIDTHASDEEILLKHCAYKADEDFFVGDYQNNLASPSSSSHANCTTTETRRPASGTFLPSFESNEDASNEDPSNEDPKHFVLFESTDVVNSSTRDLPIVEEGGTEERAQPQQRQQQQLLSDKEKQQHALETIEALACLFELPSTAHDSGKDHTKSPVSVRHLWEDQMKSSSETNNHKDEEPIRRHQNPNDTLSSPNRSRRSIFGGRVSSTTGNIVPSFSGFGIFSMETPATAAVPESLVNEDDKLHSPDNVRMLHKGDRSNSLPSCIPRKSSLKRIPSLQSSSTDGDGNGTNAPLKSSVKRTVSFGKLETREFSIALSDHPSCSYGPPISLGWDFRDKESMELEHYEQHRSPRRQMHQMILSYNVRRFLLLKRAGYSHDELEQAMNEVERVKRERLVTDLLLPASKIDETVEEVVRRVKSMFGGRQAK